ncbi:hypothetical protein ACF08B_38600 [Streptomyces sp. NPDC015139]|uniref:hypothetical protein n=1 Tax=Streptomyces sp. NPDC015139 TaxID=3364942 RepID=UPI0036FA3BBF
MSMPSSGSEHPCQDGGLSEYRVRLRVIEVLARGAKEAEPQAAPKELCRACIRLLPVSGSSVSISGGPGVRPVWCASDKTAARLAEAPHTLGAGPPR